MNTRLITVTQSFRRVRINFRLRGPLAEDPTAKVLHALLVGNSVWMVFNLAIILPFVVVAKALSVPIDLMLFLTFLAAWVLLQRGFMQQASLVYVGGMGLIVFLMTLLSGGIHSSFILPYYVALPISAAWLLGFRGSLWTAAICLVCTLGLAVLDLAGFKLPNYFSHGKPIGIFSNVLYATVIATVPAAQVLRNLKEALAASQRNVAERTRIAQELHDTLIQEMVAVGLQLDIIDDQIKEEQHAVKPTLDVVRKRVRQTISHGRHAMSELRSSTPTTNALNDEQNAVEATLDVGRSRSRQTVSHERDAFSDLPPSTAATNDLIESLSRAGMELRTGELTQFQILVHGNHCQLDPLISYELDRIGREAITNAFRHARARSIEVGLLYFDHAVRLVVRDDGCGMTPDLISKGRPEHFGLQGMRERSERAGGRLTMRSRPGGGAEVSVTIPLRFPSRDGSLSTKVASLWPFTRWIGSSRPNESKGNHAVTNNCL